MRGRVAFALAICLSSGLRALAAAAVPAPSMHDPAVQYTIDTRGDIDIVTDLIVAGEGVREYRYPLAPGSKPSVANAIDRASGKPLPARIDGKTLVISFVRPLAARAEQRLGIEETAARQQYVTPAASRDGRITFAAHVAGRATVLLPKGYTVKSTSVPAQYGAEDGRGKVGIVAVGQPATVSLELVPAPSSIAATAAGPQGGGTFRAEDERSAVYWLDQPETKRFKLSLELRLTRPGQSHVYSVLRADDHITDPEALDVDRGVTLPARIVTGREANAIGDAPSPMPDDASVFVADVGYGVPEGGSIRVRVYQSATDKATYVLKPGGELQWTRFLARLRTRIVLPPGWIVTSVDQPAAIGRDERGRVTLDFLQTGAPSPNTVLTARRISAGGDAPTPGQPASRE